MPIEKRWWQTAASNNPMAKRQRFEDVKSNLSLAIREVIFS
jgi:hypothetical protein